MKDPEAFIKKLSEKGIQALRNYPRSLTCLPQYGGKNWDDAIARKLADTVVNIPMCPTLNDSEIEYIIDVIESI